jgi:hypothetical protein
MKALLRLYKSSIKALVKREEPLGILCISSTGLSPVTTAQRISARRVKKRKNEGGKEKRKRKLTGVFYLS